jgi:hypothetical protein
MKSALTAALALAVILSVSTLASAAGSIRVKNGGKTLTVSPVLLQDGTTFAPYDALFPALGATAAYDRAAGTITAVMGDTTVVIPVDDSDITINAGDDSYSMRPAARPILNTASGRLYVPIRSAAQALGYAVSWDGPNRTVVLKSIDALIADSGATYTVMDKFLAYNRSLTEKSHAFSGAFNMTVDMESLFMGLFADGGGETPNLDPLTLSGTASGLVDKGGEELNMSLKTNFSNLAALMAEDEALDEETKEQLKQLDDFDLDLIVNNATGTTYMKSQLFSALGAVPEDAWISIETGDSGLTSYFDSEYRGSTPIGLSIVQAAGGYGSFREFVRAALRDELLSGNEDIGDVLDEINGQVSDQAIVKDGDTYSVTIADSYTISDIDGSNPFTSDFSDKLVLSFNGDTFTGISETLSSTYGVKYGDGAVKAATEELSFSYTASGQGKLVMKSTVGDVTSLALNIDFAYIETLQTPAREPSDGSKVIPAGELPAEDTPASADQAA